MRNGTSHLPLGLPMGSGWPAQPAYPAPLLGYLSESMPIGAPTDPPRAYELQGRLLWKVVHLHGLTRIMLKELLLPGRLPCPVPCLRAYGCVCVCVCVCGWVVAHMCKNSVQCSCARGSSICVGNGRSEYLGCCGMCDYVPLELELLLFGDEAITVRISQLMKH